MASNPTALSPEQSTGSDAIATVTRVAPIEPETLGSHETPNDWTWWISFGAAMVPFTAFCYGHHKGMTVRVVHAVVKSPLGPAGLLLLPFCTLAMEKSIYDTVQAAQGMDPTTRPVDRGGFPSGGAELFPSLSLIPVQPKRRNVASRPTAEVASKQ